MVDRSHEEAKSGLRQDVPPRQALKVGEVVGARLKHRTVLQPELRQIQLT